MKKKMISLALALLMVLSLLPVTAFADGPTELTIGVKMFGFQMNLPPIGSGDFYVTSNPSGYIEVEPSSGTITSGQTIIAI